MDRGSKEYELAERIVFLEEALARANGRFKEKGELGISPARSVSFRNGKSHHAKVRKILK